MTARIRLCLWLAQTFVLRQRTRLVVALCVGIATACSDGPTAAPRRGTILVFTKTSGGDPDLDGYNVVLDTNAVRILPVNGSLYINDVIPGAHTVSLEMVAENCTASGGNQRSLNVSAGQSVDVIFEVVCVATGIAVTTYTTGSEHPNTYQLAVNGGRSMLLDANNSLVVSRLQAGTYTVALSIPSDNCTVAGGTLKTVAVSAHTVTPLAFEITCDPPLRRTKIAYAVDTIVDGARDTWIAVVNVDGSRAVTLAPGNSPAWSPDGTRLVFSDAHCGSYYYYGYFDCSGGVVVIDPELRNVSRLTDGNAGFSPAWAPTNDAIAVVRCCDKFVQPGLLFVIALHGSAPVDLHVPVWKVLRPIWSPDGQRIAFACVVDPGNSDLCIINRDGTGFQRLTSGAASESDPAWSPDGKRIAFTKNDSIALITLADGGVTTLTSGREPSWPPDGSNLVFVGDGRLVIINANGSNRKPLTSPGNYHAPVWRP